MDWITAQDVRSLAEERGAPRVSIFMGTHLGTIDIQQDPIRLKNLLRQARERLVSTHGLRGPDADALLEPAWSTLQLGEIWREQGGALAAFISRDGVKAFRVPAELAEAVYVNDRFHLTPLVPLLRAEERFYVLTLAQRHGVRLLECVGTSVTRLELPKGTPADMETAIRVNERGNSLQWSRSGGMVGGANRKDNRGSSQFHSNSVDNQTADAEQRDFMQQLERGVYQVIKLDNAPLVLAGAEFMQALYRDTNQYQNLYEKGIVGTAKTLNDGQLRDQARDLLEPYFDQSRRSAMSRFREYFGTGKASTDAAQIVPAAVYGRIESLLVAEGHQWGRFDEESGQVVVHNDPQPGDDDLADLATSQTLLTGGEVYSALPGMLPNGAPMAAVFRY